MEFRNQDGDVQLPSSSSSSPPFSLIYSPPPIRGSAFSKPVLHASSSSLLSPKGGGARNGSANFGSSARVSSQDPAPISSLFPSSKSYTGEGGKAADEVAVRYKECLRNHAAAAGGHVLDGCGEFMPNGIDALKCAACGCHRSFHRRDSDADADADDVGSHHRGGAQLPLPLLLPPPPPPHYHHHRTAAYGAGGFPSSPLLPSRVVPVSSSGVMASGGTTTESSSEERVVGGAPTRKRFRTKFTAEQKEKMVAFAERIGWRLQRHEEALVEQFCSEAGIKRHVLKVWMHNNKHSIKKQQQQQQQQEQQLPPQEQLQLMAREQ